jgi:hypothetical protein
MQKKMNKNLKIRLLFFSTLALITFLPPDFSTVENAYQCGLWTSNDSPPEEATGFAFKFGRDIGFTMVKWDRIRLGFPFKPVTIDIQTDYSIVQARIEPDSIIVNILFMGTVGCVALLIFIGIGRLRKTVHRARGH